MSSQIQDKSSPNMGREALEKEAIRIAKELICRVVVGSNEEGRVTKSNLNNMLKAVALARDKNDYNVFEIAVAYLARSTDFYDDLNWFVRNLLSRLRKLFNKYNITADEKKIEIADMVVKAAIMVYRGREAGINIICK